VSDPSFAIYTEPECPGVGKCHGCLKWCNTCGDVAHVCDVRLRDERCDAHPVPESPERLRLLRREAEQMIRAGKQMLADGERQLAEVIEEERASREYLRQMAEVEEREMKGAMG